MNLEANHSEQQDPDLDPRLSYKPDPEPTMGLQLWQKGTIMETGSLLGDGLQAGPRN